MDKSGTGMGATVGGDSGKRAAMPVSANRFDSHGLEVMNRSPEACAMFGLIGVEEYLRLSNATEANPKRLAHITPEYKADKTRNNLERWKRRRALTRT